MRRLDLWLLDWTARTWRLNDKAILDRVAELNPPFKGLLEKSTLVSMLEIWREGADQSAQVIQRLRGWERRRRKEMLAMARELFEEGRDYDEVVAAYAVLAKQIGEKQWTEKVVATRNLASAGYAEGWGLNDYKVYIDGAGNRVSAFEATGGAGGAANLKAGYKQIVQTPGIISQLRKELNGYTEWQLERIARTETTRAYNQGMLDSYQKDDAVVGYEFVAIVDSRTTDRCLMLDGTIIHRDDPRLYELTPPLHVNCRSQLSPVFVFDDKIAATLDDPITRTLETRKGKEYSLTYNPDRMMPMSREGKLTRTGFGRENLMTKAESEVRRKDFVPPTPDEMRKTFLGV